MKADPARTNNDMNNDFRILIAHDGSDSADAAIDDIARAGLPEEGVEALVVSVAEVWLPPQDGESGERRFLTEGLKKKYQKSLEIFHSAGETAREAAQRLRSLFPGWDVRSDSTYGSPAWEILSVAEKFKADLIVVGAKGMSAVEKVLLGSVSQKIVTEANCPVRVSRGKVEIDRAPVRLLVGYDGSAGSREAVRTISGRNWRENTHVMVVIVEDSIFIRSSLEIELYKIEKVGAELVKDLNDIGLNATLSVVEGSPKVELLNEAAKFFADCIFIGATQFNDVLTKYLLGSVSSAVVTRANCSVEVVRPVSYESADTQ